ncbi:hypothetical protein DYI25_01715 [Mesobacillus boroniphilus]|uniref:Uncharacterized protein n=1 Tax=Mesobacillus boroniphilus TaxID=308892 RepID=A0A944CIL4_9BACI|nr:hypothetical protein [Mesobacillus boroniphilus]MBS8263150.1 hypothetical protein [Mesobacillus boroniphilus]
MFLYNAYVFFTLAAVILISIVQVLRHKADMTVMNGMITSMYLGMNIGLTCGILLGAVFQGDLFLSTTLSMLTGAAAGLIMGALFSAAGAIEGLMSGIMGGMMGAMLGEMLPPEKSLVLINIFLTISISTIFLFKILQQTSSYAKSLKDFVKPVLAFILLSTYLLTGTHLGKAWLDDFIHNTNHNGQHQNP